jgi:hypothetical protein
MNQAEARDRGHLPPAESVLLLAIRVEVEGLRTGVDRRSHVRAILDMLACPNADRALLDFIGSLAAPGAAARPLAISGVSRPLITPDERLLIDVIALQQQGRSHRRFGHSGGCRPPGADAATRRAALAGARGSDPPERLVGRQWPGRDRAHGVGTAVSHCAQLVTMSCTRGLPAR